MESIQIVYQPLPSGLYHTLLVYTDGSGEQHALRGGPTNGGGLDELTVAEEGSLASETDSPFGSIKIDQGDWGAGFIDYDNRSSADYWGTVATGDNLSDAWNNITDAASEIANRGYDYRPVTSNCNSVTNTILDEVPSVFRLPKGGVHATSFS